MATDVGPGEHDGQIRKRYFFQLEVSSDTPDTWHHTVTDGNLDKGRVFAYRWLGLPEAKAILSHMGDNLERLE